MEEIKCKDESTYCKTKTKKKLVFGIVIMVIIMLIFIVLNVNKKEFYSNAEIVYTNLKEVADSCIEIMDAKYNAWL